MLEIRLVIKSINVGLDNYNFTNGSSLWFDNSTALSEEEQILHQKLNSSFGVDLSLWS